MIQDAIKKYKELGEYFNPEYGGRNVVLDAFKNQNPFLTPLQIDELTSILANEDIYAKYFVADLLYLYDNFNGSLLDPMVVSAIRCKDPSFNRVFINPCIKRFGYERVLSSIEQKFMEGDILDKIGVSNLLYHLRPKERIEFTSLMTKIRKRVVQTDNIIELYYYKRCIGDVKESVDIPSDAQGLVDKIAGNIELEDLLFNKIGWTRK